MKKHKSLISFFLLFLVLTQSKCVWYGMCNSTTTPQYLAKDTEPVKLDDNTAALLGKFCPEYVGKKNETCCDAAQVNTFTTQLNLAAIFLSGCPACYRNFQSLFCAMTCDPEQHKYVRPDKIDANKCVTDVTYFVSQEYKKNLFKSCDNVQYSGAKAVSIICESDKCNYEDFFNHLGTSDRAPFHTDFKEVAPKPYTIHNGNLYKCSQKVNKTKFNRELPACICEDCLDSCYAPSFIMKAASLEIFKMNVYWFSMIVTFAVFLLMIILGHFIYFLRKRMRQSVDEDETPLYEQSVDALKKKIGWQLKLSAAIERHLSTVFYHIGKYVSQYSYFFIISSIVVIGIFGFGLRYFKVTTNPIELWSAPHSRGRIEKEYFDTHFGPFYRIEQIVIRASDKYKRKGYGPVWNKEFLKRALDLQNELTNLQVPYKDGKSVTLKDICFKPLHPVNDNCAITSPLEYFQANPMTFECRGSEDNFYKHMESCAKNPYQIREHFCRTQCFGSSGIPINANIAFGGYDNEDFTQARSMVITYLVNNNNNQTSEQIEMAKAWELSYINHLKKWSKNNPDLSIGFSSERSIEDELSRQSESDLVTVLLSYLVMFLYVTLTLGSYRSCKRFFVDVKITLGLGGVMIVLLAVVAAIGLCSYFRIPASLISIEVIPFLVLAIGVDNIYIIVQTFENYQVKRKRKRLFEYSDEDGSLEDFDEISSIGMGAEASQFHSNKEFRSAEITLRISKTLSKVGPSIFLSSLSESCAFFCGAITNMPAVRVFALYAGIAIMINFFLQITFFLALLSLDALKQSSNRFDVLCCLKMKKRQVDDELFLNNEPSAETDENQEQESKNRPFLVRVVADYMTPFILHRVTRGIVLVIMVAWTCFCIAIIPNGLEVGLDQKLSMPLDSFVLKYFEDISTELKVGPPAYFVITEGFDYTRIKDQNMICGSIGCDFTSLNSRVQFSSNYANLTYISGPKFSWIDDYFSWLRADSTSYSCCRVYNNDPKKFCPQSVKSSECQNCPLDPDQRPRNAEEFNFFLPYFLSQAPDPNCPLGGSAAHGHSVDVKDKKIKTSYIMTYHTPLRNSDDFIQALENARAISDNFNDGKTIQSSSAYKIPERSVFPYSVFYVFYDQYNDMVAQTIKSTAICGSAIGLITFLMLGLNYLATLVVIIGVSQILLSVLAIMVLTGITLNAISLVNLVVSIGIGVEFCIHIVHEFTVSLHESRLLRAKVALSNMGSSVLRGITLTKFGGILVLAFTKSRLFQIFYFRMYLSLVLSGAVVGLIFVPVLLSFIGPGINLALLVERKTQEEVRNRANDFRDNTSDQDDEDQ